MPQLIAMIIVVVGAMIYMFQTFGGTGDKIEGVAQKASIITEINNIKDGIKIAARSGHIEATASTTTDAAADLKGLADLSYFAEQINEQIIKNADTTNNTYNAISFGGTEDTAGGMKLSLYAVAGKVPGILVDLGFTGGNLSSNAAFLEAQVATDLESIAHIDRGVVVSDAGVVTAGTAAWSTTETTLEARMPKTTATTANTLKDGKFIIYFNDFGSDEVVQ